MKTKRNTKIRHHSLSVSTTPDPSEPLGTTHSVCRQIREPEFNCFTNWSGSVVAEWQAGAISRDTMLNLLRRGEFLPEGRTMEEELKLIEREKKPPARSGSVVAKNQN